MRSLIKPFVRIDPVGGGMRSKTFFKAFYRPLVNKRSEVYIWSRRSVITPLFSGKRVAVYNGKKFFSFIVRPSMIGFRFGEFSFTKKVNAIHKVYKRSSRLKRDRPKAAVRLDKGKKKKAMKNRLRIKKMRKTLSGKRKKSKLQLR